MLDLSSLTQYIQDLSSTGIYFFLGASAIIENIFPPYPGDTVTVFCGFLVAHDVITMPGAFFVVLVGNLIGAWIMYFAGEKILAFARHLHDSFEKPVFIKKALAGLVSKESMEKTTIWFNKSGIWFVLISRFSAGIRFFVSIIAGISKMNLFIFSFVFTIGVLVWNTLLLYGGYALGDNWEMILVGLRIYNQVIITCLVVAGLGIFYWKWRQKKNNHT